MADVLTFSTHLGHLFRSGMVRNLAIKGHKVAVFDLDR